ncbi:MAG TPA: hypothetical protein VE178_19180, partial [Silvibacterium sp.]|nr:hypothetical protein [Silvibacterium sp.]
MSSQSTELGAQSTEGFDPGVLDTGLVTTRFVGKVRFFRSIASTNTHAMAEADTGAPDGMVYV